MRYTAPPTSASPWKEEPEDIDRLLSAFFKAEMPTELPECPVPEEKRAILPPPSPQRPPKKQRSQWHSRLALAASVAVFLLVPWLISGSGDGSKDQPGAGFHHRLYNPGATIPKDDPRLDRMKGRIIIRDESLEVQPSKKGTTYKMTLEQQLP